VSAYYTGPSGENIAAGQPDPASAMAGWMGSPDHKANILSSAWEIGVGYSSGSGDYVRYWVQDFGKRSGVYPLVINREAASATSTGVSLYIYGNFKQMRLKTNRAPGRSGRPSKTI